MWLVARGSSGRHDRSHLTHKTLPARLVLDLSLDRGLGVTEPPCDLGDRKALLVAVVTRERCRPTALLNAVQSHHTSDDTAAHRREKVPSPGFGE